MLSIRWCWKSTQYINEHLIIDQCIYIPGSGLIDSVGLSGGCSCRHRERHPHYLERSGQRQDDGEVFFRCYLQEQNTCSVSCGLAFTCNGYNLNLHVCFFCWQKTVAVLHLFSEYIEYIKCSMLTKIPSCYNPLCAIYNISHQCYYL